MINWTLKSHILTLFSWCDQCRIDTSSVANVRSKIQNNRTKDIERKTENVLMPRHHFTPSSINAVPLRSVWPLSTEVQYVFGSVSRKWVHGFGYMQCNKSSNNYIIIWLLMQITRLLITCVSASFRVRRPYLVVASKILHPSISPEVRS